MKSFRQHLRLTVWVFRSQHVAAVKLLYLCASINNVF